jgi:hypothetical protein
MKKAVFLFILVAGAGIALLSSTDHDFAVAKGMPPCTVTISNIDATEDPLACTMTITWDTNVTSSSLVRWDTDPCGSQPPYDNTATGDDGTSHSVTFDISGVPASKLTFQVESAKVDCDTTTSSCQTENVLDCLGG